MYFRKVLVTVVLLGLFCGVARSESISGSLLFAAVGEYVESGGVVTGYDFSPIGSEFNQPGLIMLTDGDILDVLGVRGLGNGGYNFLDVIDFDLNALPAVEWVVPVDNGDGITGLLSFVITGGTPAPVGPDYWVDLTGTGILSFECLAPGESSGGAACANDPGFTPSVKATWTLSKSLKSLSIIGHSVAAPAPLALLGCAFVAFSIGRRRISSVGVRKCDECHI